MRFNTLSVILRCVRFFRSRLEGWVARTVYAAHPSNLATKNGSHLKNERLRSLWMTVSLRMCHS